ncbi:MAG: hypothetical protein KC505_07405 [Myxococcales bacterium]|nr:hypothetical protein [Myxococcales bacterium]
MINALFFVVMLFSLNSFTTISVSFTNDGANDICLMSYNGKDSTFAIPYQYKQVNPGETKSVKCLGQGKGRCKIEVSRRLDGESMSGKCQAVFGCSGDNCPDDITDPSGTKIRKNDTCTYSSEISSVTDQVAGESITCDNSDSTIEYTNNLNP